MGAVWLWARADLRRRWRAVAVLAILLGLAGGFVLTALVGARRASTGWERLRAELLAPDAFVSIPSRADADVDKELRSLPGVVEAASFVFVSVAPPGLDEGGAFAAVDHRLGRTISRWRVLEGRLADPGRADEVTVNPAMAETAQVRPGGRLRLTDPSPTGTFSADVTVVGITAGTLDLSQNAGFPGAYLTPAFLARHAGEVDVGRQNQFVRLERGLAGVAAFRAAVTAHFSDGGGVLVGAEEDSAIRDALALQAASLALVAAAAAVATLLGIGEALARHIAAGADDGGALHALGMTRSGRAARAVPTVGVVAGIGTALAVVVAIAASPVVPTGLAGVVEPDPGVTSDVVALAGGGLVLAALVGGAGVLAARRAARRTGRQASPRRDRPMAVRLGPAATVGLANATGRGTGRSRAAARSAVAAAAAGALSVAAATTFAASLDRLVSTPRLFGWDFDALVGVGGEDPDRVDAAAEDLARDPDVSRLAVADVVFLVLGRGAVEATVLDQRKGEPIHPTIVAGRRPGAPGEIALGTKTMKDLGVGLGSRVEGVGTDGPVDLTVVGRAVYPTLGDGLIDDAASLSADTAADLRQEESRGRFVMLSVVPGRDPLAVAARHTDLPVGGPMPPSDVTNLRQVGSAPWLLAAFFAAVAAAAVGHALVLSVRAGRRELAVLRALGFLRSQVWATVIWQATATMAIGLVIGLPLGVAAGRWLWTSVGGGTGAVVEPAVAASLLAVGPVALVLASLIAIGPGRAAARTPPALVLRTE